MKLKVFVIGVMLVFVVSFALILLLGADSSLFLPMIVVSYGISGIIVGWLWPEGGWRLGLWLVAFWFIMMVLSIPFSDPSAVPWNGKEAMRNLMANGMIVVAACLGAEVGAIIKHRRIS